MRDRLIESRLTPNAISLTGFALNLLAAVLVWRRTSPVATMTWRSPPSLWRSWAR